MFFKNRPLKGFTLTELLIALVIFAIFISSTSVILVHVQRGYEESLITQKLSSETFFVMEKMSQTLRRVRRAADPACIPVGAFYQITAGGNGIRFIIDQGGTLRCQEFSLENGSFRISDTTGGVVHRFDLISPGLRAKRSNGLPIFAPIDTGRPTEQPGVYIRITIYTRTAAGLLITQENRTAVSIRK